ncbi:MAG TPA: helix-turn-helix transcriptional regulator [Azospirillum sp.]|nr:helix-turn-helix transcriptional regulator [Azospirillum sp.]
MKPEQCRIARELLDWSQQDLERRSGVDQQMVVCFESSRSAASDPMISCIKRTLETAGIEFIDWGNGVRLSEHPMGTR